MNRVAFRTAALAAALSVLPASAQTPTPRDPKSPVPDCADGRGPTGPVELKILAPAPDVVLPIPPAPAGQPAARWAPGEVRFGVKNYETFLDPKTQTGQGVAIVFDNGPAAVHYAPSEPWAYPKVPAGTHTIRAFLVRPWGESLKDPGAFAMVTFSVGEKNGKNAPAAAAPLLTPNRPKGKYVKGEKILLDFLVTGCTVAEQNVPNSCRVRYRVDDLPEVTLSKPDPVWLTDLAPGKHAYVIGLTREGKVVGGPFNVHQGVFEVVEPAAAAPAPASAAPSPPKAGAPSPGR